MTTGVVVIAAGRHEHVRRTIAALAAQWVSPARTVLVDLGSSPPLADLVGDDDVDVVELRGDTSRRTAVGGGAQPGCGPGLHRVRRLPRCRLHRCARPGRPVRAGAGGPPGSAGLRPGPLPATRVDDRLGEHADVDVEGLVAGSDAPTARPAPADGSVVVDGRHDLFWSLSFGVSAATWDVLGGFDTGYVGYGAEDTDLAYRARSLGRSVAWFGGGTAFHQWHPPSRLDPARTGELVRNARRFRRRWGRWPMEGWLHELAAAGRVEFDPAADRLELVGPSP